MRLIWLWVMLLVTTQAVAIEAPSVETAIANAQAAYAKVDDYTCILKRRERVDGKLKEKGDVLFKYKKPSRYYMKWVDDSIEAIYAQGKYDNRMVIHGGLLLKFISIAVDPTMALKTNRHTLLEADIGHILEVMKSNYRMAKLNGDAQITFEKRAVLDGREIMVFGAVFPPGKGYYGHRVTIDIDRELHLPIRITVLGWQEELLEMYHYSSLKLNVGLTEEEFDMNNSSYLFRLGSMTKQ